MAPPLTYEKDFGLTLGMTPAGMAAAVIAHDPRITAHEACQETGLVNRLTDAITAFKEQCAELLYRDDGSFVEHALRSHHKARPHRHDITPTTLAAAEPSNSSITL